MKKAVIRKGDTVLFDNVDITTGFWERFRGLMNIQSIPDNYALMIRPCNQVHMFNMKFPLDVIYLSKNNTVVHVDEDLRPWKVGKTVKGAVSVIEVNSGTCARCDICPGDILNIAKS